MLEDRWKGVERLAPRAQLESTSHPTPHIRFVCTHCVANPLQSTRCPSLLHVASAEKQDGIGSFMSAEPRQAAVARAKAD
eukprot:365704-Chlamydomonas_euryale.AAC.9